MEIPVPIPTGRQYLVTATGSTARHVRCENCGCEYVYIVTAEATGGAASPLFLNEHGARQRARGSAKSRLREKLANTWSIVACPDCGWLQKHMVQMVRRARLILMCVIGLGIPLGYLYLKWIGAPEDHEPDYHFKVVLPIIAIIAGFIAAIHFGWDLNANPTRRIAADPTQGGRAIRRADFEKLLATQAMQEIPLS